MATRDIRTHTPVTACDVCGRTLLRGERAEVYLAGGERRSVCELCKSRALHEGWVREGTVPELPSGESGRDSGGSLLRRLRSRRGGGARERPAGGAGARRRGRRDEEVELEPVEPPLEDAEWGEIAGGEPEPDEVGGPEYEAAEPEPAAPERHQEPPPPVPARPRGRRSRRRPSQREAASVPREPRHVRAVPTSPQQKCVAAIEVFNGSEYTRTVAGVARSLGAPVAAVHADAGHSTTVQLVVSWELCWYRYEVDLSDEVPAVRPAGQGYELDELEPWEREGNVLADERGALIAPERR